MIGYKYRSNTSYDNENGYRDINSLLNDEIYASSFSFLNDPFEATYVDNMDKALSMIEKIFNAKTDDIKKAWNDLANFKDKVGVYSLSLSDKDFPDNELMWAHYADSHKGFCIGYDIDKLEDSEKYIFDVDKMQIDYKDVPPVIGIDDINKINEPNDRFLIKMFGTKSKLWSYEKEMRLLYSESGIKKYNPFALKNVYFGFGMEDQLIQDIIEGLENRDVSFYKMSRKVNSYELIPVLVHKNKRNIENRLLPSQYEILKTGHCHAVENFHVLYKDKDLSENKIKEFVHKFREEYATKEANVFVYDSKDIVDLIDVYPLIGDDSSLMALHHIAMSISEAPNEVLMYPDRIE